MHVPVLVMLAGLPGAGKSRLAAALAREAGCTVLDKDLVHTVVLEAGMARDQAAGLAYDIVFRLTEDLLTRQRQSVIVDSAGRQPLILERMQTIAQAGGVRLKVIRCLASAPVREARMAGRIALPTQWTQNQATADDEQRWYAHLPAETLMLDMEQPFEQAVQIALRFIGSDHPPVTGASSA